MRHIFCSHPPHPRAGCNGLPPLRVTPPCCTTPSRRSQLATRRSCGHKITCPMWPSRRRHPFLPLHRGGCKGFGNEGLQEGVGSRIRGIGSILLLIITATLSRNTTDPPGIMTSKALMRTESFFSGTRHPSPGNLVFDQRKVGCIQCIVYLECIGSPDGAAEGQMRRQIARKVSCAM